MESIADSIDMEMLSKAKIKVVGVGGAGGNAVQEMINNNLVGVEFICANTDLQALNANHAAHKVQLGEKLTQGLGAGAKPEIGREAAIESINSIREAIGEGTNMVFVTAGMGGGTGTGAAPVIAQAAKELGALTVGVVTKPFSYEGMNRKKEADKGLAELAKQVDSLIIIPNDRLMSFAPKKTPIKALFQKANEILFNAVRGISDVILRPGLINLDFADVRTVMLETGLGLMGTGRATGENRAREATLQAIKSPLLEDIALESAKGILYNITASADITGEEVQEIGYLIHDAAANDPNIKIIFGIVIDESIGEELQVTVIATGIEQTVPAEEKIAGQATVSAFRNNPQQNQQQKWGFAEKNINTQSSTNEDADEEKVKQRPARRSASELWQHERPRNSGYGKDNYYHARKYSPGKDMPKFAEDDLEIPTFLLYTAD